MPRIGMNPSRGITLDFEPARTTVAVLVYVPHRIGYFQNRMDVVKITIQSILVNTTEPYDLLVFDNGSCPEMVNYLLDLQKTGSIDYLLLSKRNIGKLNALKMIFNIAPGEIVAYCDDDIYHFPGWLGKHLEIIDTFPNVGAVTGFYVRQRVMMSSKSTLDFAERSDVDAKHGMLIPQKWEEEYLVNTGRSWERYNAEVSGIEDVIVKYKGLEAWVSAHHFQMVSPKKILQEILSEMLPEGWTDHVMGRMVEMDDIMDSKGYLRLCTREQTVRHMGNVISEEISQLAQKMEMSVQAEIKGKEPRGLMHRLSRVKWIRYLLQGIINRLYNWLHK